MSGTLAVDLVDLDRGDGVDRTSKLRPQRFQVVDQVRVLRRDQDLQPSSASLRDETESTPVEHQVIAG
jgi:hypothetical protein